MTYDIDPVPITHSAAINVGSTIRMRDIRRLAATADVPDTATVTIQYYGGDQREQTAGSNRITMTWTS